MSGWSDQEGRERSKPSGRLELRSTHLAHPSTLPSMSWRYRLLAAAGAGGSLLTAYATNYLDPFSPPLRPVLQRVLDPELTHDLAIYAFEHSLIPKPRAAPALWPGLRQELWGLNFHAPLGLAAGFDKDARAVDPLLNAGFAFVEIGSVTPRPQPGNPKPRVFRLPEDKAVINRYGFNSDGVEAVATRLARRDDGRPVAPGVLGVNLGKNKTSEDAAADYAYGVRHLAQFADYLVINVSSPNTPGLRSLQGEAELRRVVRAVIGERDRLAAEITERHVHPPVWIKVAPDLDAAGIAGVALVALEEGVDAIVVGNTTVSRPESLRGDPAVIAEAGGLSGAPLKELSNRVLKEMYEATGGRIALVGVGGVASGADAYEKIRLGATLVQLYTALVYEGPKVARRVNEELAELLKRDGFVGVGQAVGVDTDVKRQGKGGGEKKRSGWLSIFEW
mmetsp:Transcript_27415/g.68790  ORF Transcript_27415/g.68790 Transcript_27415/m.68790 type:complete len:449 (+) Transcript_27415:1248-2594(+)